MTNFHVVRSVKGGSGKTTFALHKVVDLAKKNEDEKKVLYVDADVHASETRNLLMADIPQVKGDKNSEPICIQGTPFFVFYDGQYLSSRHTNIEEMKKCFRHTLNSFMHPYKGYYSKESELAVKGILKIPEANITEDMKNNDTYELSDKFDKLGEAHFIFSDPSPYGRNVFGSLYQSYGKSAISAGAYIAKMKVLFKYIIEDGFADVVLDMPPGSDAFSEHLMDCLIRFANEEDYRNECSVNIYYVSTRDCAHIRSATEAAIEHLHTMRLKAADKIYYVDNMGLNNKDATLDRSELINKIESAFRYTRNIYGSPISNLRYELDRLTYCRLAHDEYYFQSARGEIQGFAIGLDMIQNID